MEKLGWLPDGEKNLKICLLVSTEYTNVTHRRTEGRTDTARSMAALTRSIALAVWLSGNALASINVVALRQTRLVPGWVTVCGRVNHLGM